ncbi:hypothetical protein GCM10012285_55200 [Streptomyces kronopolitis]|uniref:Uncharacterized protein n=1 Tax=Streptomyces kronopolitis TaxID=1612435 RepID=A0ABQ2JVI4_9ACTN|nr:hypothetical protein GCM10012285_55200 [Streptomyces kronopolitis]
MGGRIGGRGPCPRALVRERLNQILRLLIDAMPHRSPRHRTATRKGKERAGATAKKELKRKKSPS